MGALGAGEVAVIYFEKAKSLWEEDQGDSIYYLGWVLHFIMDLTVPHHALASIPSADNGHQMYEIWVERNHEKFSVTKGGIYDFPLFPLESQYGPHYSPDSALGWVDYASHISIDYYSLVNDKLKVKRNAELVAGDLVPLAQRLVAGFMHFFLSTVNP